MTIRGYDEFKFAISLKSLYYFILVNTGKVNSPFLLQRINFRVLASISNVAPFFLVPFSLQPLNQQ